MDVSQQIDLAQRVLSSLSHSAKTQALYQHQNQGHENFFRKTHELIQNYHHYFGDLTVVVKPFDLQLLDQSVYNDGVNENSIPYKMHISGIRTFTFERGIQLKDLLAVSKLLTMPAQAMKDADLASLLWKYNIPHVSYLQLQMLESAEESGNDGLDENFEEIFKHIAVISEQDPRSQVNFRTFDAGDLQAGQFLQGTHTKRTLEGQAAQVHHQLIQYIPARLKKENDDLLKKGSALLYQLLHFADSRAAIEQIQQYLFVLCERLFIAKDLKRLALLFEEFEQMNTQRGSQHSYALLKQGFFDYFTAEGRIEHLFSSVAQLPSISEEQKHYIHVFLSILGVEVQEHITRVLPDLSSKVRRALLEILFSMSHHPSHLMHMLQHNYGHLKDFGVDLLIAGRKFPEAFTFQQLETLLDSPEKHLQREAVRLIAVQYPDRLNEMYERLFITSGPGFQRVVFEELCKSGPECVPLLFEYTESKEFAKMNWKEQADHYRLLGQSKQPEILEWFAGILEHKSGVFGRSKVDHYKRLAIKGIQAFGNRAAKRLIEKNLDQKIHSREVIIELEDSLRSFVMKGMRF